MTALFWLFAVLAIWPITATLRDVRQAWPRIIQLWRNDK